MNARRTSASAIAALVAVTLTGCTLGTNSVPDLAEAQLHPVGDQAEWFDDSYAHGYDDEYTTEGRVCGIADDLIIESLEDLANLTMTVQAWSLTQREVVWTIEDATCDLDAVADGTVLIREGASENLDWSLVDLATGEPQRTLEVDQGIQTMRRELSTPEIEVLRANQTQLLGLNEAGLEWQIDLGDSASVTPLDNGLLGVESGLDTWIMVIDAATGEQVLERTEPDADFFTWASDGYILRINQSDPEYAYFDVTGSEVDRTVGDAQFGLFPRPRAGITFPIADHVAAGTVVAVDASGTPSILTQPSGHTLFTREANVDDSEFDFFIPSGVSHDGSLVLLSAGMNSMAVVDLDANVVFEYEPDDRISRTEIEDGYIVFETHSSTVVLLPGSP